MSEMANMNKDVFLQIVAEKIHRPGIEKLLDWLTNQSDFFTAPASSRYHSAYEGGLCEHSLNVYNRVHELYKQEKNAPLTDAEEETLAIVSLFHDLCKTNYYKVDYKNAKTYDVEKVKAASRYQVKHDERGDFVWETVPYYSIDDTWSYGHGECSVDILRDYIVLSQEEKLAIRWHMGFSDVSFKGGSGTVGDAFNKCKLAVMLHTADLLATYLDEGENV